MNKLPNTPEIWRPVINYEGYYEVSNLGRVRSVDREIMNMGGRKCINKIKGRDLKSPISNGYHIVRLSKKSTCFNKRVHRLVAQAFIPNTDNKPEVNHINGIKTDNRVENLEWCTPKENMKHAFSNGLMSDYSLENNGHSKLKNYEVSEIKEMLISGHIKQVDIAKKFNVTNKTINYIKTGKTWKEIL